MHLSVHGSLFCKNKLVQLILIVAENLVVFLPAESYILSSCFVGVYHTGIYCLEKKTWEKIHKNSLSYKDLEEVEFNSSS